VSQQTPESWPGPLLEDEIKFYDQYGVLPSTRGGMVYSDGYFYMQDGYEMFIVMSPLRHKRLKQLIHYIDDGPTYLSGAYREILPAGNPFPTSIVWWESASKINKIVETIITRNANKMPSSVVWQLYDVGSVVETVTDSISYQNNIFEISRTRTIS
jgi:hypothetical protein